MELLDDGDICGEYRLLNLVSFFFFWLMCFVFRNARVESVESIISR